MAHTTLEPNVEEVTQFGVHYVVVVGRVNGDVVDGAICNLT
jgi:hypothetical protein